MNPSTALATVIVNALVDLGVRQVVLCPGSRSAPLAYALMDAAEPADPDVGSAGARLRLHVRIDERSAGFLALGLALGSGRPVAVVVTSGTAVANLHPAVLEAAHAGVPLLVVSADRPHELRGSGASQTTDQVKIFGSAVRWFGEIPAPHRGPDQVRVWRNVVARAVAAATGTPGDHPGPVQLNVAFADPLLPDEPRPSPRTDGSAEPSVAARSGSPEPWAPADSGRAEPSTSAGPDRSDGSTEPSEWPEPLADSTGLTWVSEPAAPVPVVLPAGPRTVVLAGDGAGPEAAELARRAGWPLLAEPSSGARVAGAIGPYRLLLALPELGARIERVVVHGRPTLSRPVTRLLSRRDVQVIVVSRRPDWTDATRRADLVVPAARFAGSRGRVGQPDEVDDLSRTGDLNDVGELDDVDDPQWLAAWQRAGAAAATAIDRELDQQAATGRLTGPLVARELAAATRAGDVLFTGSSNPVRDLDLAAGPFDPAARVLANRGLAGIDGTLSSASGVALSTGPAVTAGPAGTVAVDTVGTVGRGGTAGAGSGAGHVRCLVGDLTFLHDAGGLLVGLLEQRPDLQIVVLDDGGGGIFSLLEHGARSTRGPDGQSRQRVFERTFGTPQDADLGALCAGYGVRHEQVDDVDRLRKALAEPPAGTSVLQVLVDRSAHRALADRLRDVALTAVRE